MRESILTNIFSSIRRIETITGHGSWGQGFSFPEDQNDIKTMTATLGTALNQLADIYKHLNMVDLLFTDLQALAPAMQYDGTNKVLCAGNKSITDAISIIRQQPSQARDQAQYLEVRVRSQSSVLFSLLTHQDAQVNIRAANASIELAAAARRDGSSMKTIAVLTMAFLPATFFAAFFSIPSLGWTEPGKLALFWACTLPVTVATFLLWAAITQRKAMRGAIMELTKMMRGKRGEVESSSGGNSLTMLDLGVPGRK